MTLYFDRYSCSGNVQAYRRGKRAGPCNRPAPFKPADEKGGLAAAYLLVTTPAGWFQATAPRWPTLRLANSGVRRGAVHQAVEVMAVETRRRCLSNGLAPGTLRSARRDEALALSGKNGFPEMKAMSGTTRGWALAALGRREEGVSAVVESLGADACVRCLTPYLRNGDTGGDLSDLR
jgi:hypothetical protein